MTEALPKYYGFIPILRIFKVRQRSFREPVTLIARLRLAAGLYAPAPPSQPGQNGRPPSGTDQASQPSPSVGCWSEIPRAPSTPKLCSAPTPRQTQPKFWNGLCCAGSGSLLLDHPGGPLLLNCAKPSFEIVFLLGPGLANRPTRPASPELSSVQMAPAIRP